MQLPVSFYRTASIASALSVVSTFGLIFLPDFFAPADDLAARMQRVCNAGLKMVIGTDCGSAGHYHGDAIWWEMATWHPLECHREKCSRPRRRDRRG
jgi:hypothetical protein